MAVGGSHNPDPLVDRARIALLAIPGVRLVLSVVLHGLSAGPLATRYGRRMASLPSGAPELEETVEPQPPRTSWAGSERL
jgi:hypothetical protein